MADEQLVHRAALHAAVGEPVRLAIVEELLRSDRAPVELAERFALPTNLLAHHLAVLERVGLIERTVSSGDRRRRYVRIVADAASGVVLVAEQTSVAAAPSSTVFVCTHNSARSQLAAALWTDLTGAAASSAGTHPASRVHPGAVAAGRRRGLEIAGVVPRSLRDGELDAADLVVTVCDRAHEEIDLPSTAVHWSIADPFDTTSDTPSGATSGDPFDAAAAAIERRIAMFIPSPPDAVGSPRRITP